MTYGVECFTEINLKGTCTVLYVHIIPYMVVKVKNCIVCTFVFPKAILVLVESTFRTDIERWLSTSDLSLDAFCRWVSLYQSFQRLETDECQDIDWQKCTVEWTLLCLHH